MRVPPPESVLPENSQEMETFSSACSPHPTFPEPFSNYFLESFLTTIQSHLIYFSRSFSRVSLCLFRSGIVRGPPSIRAAADPFTYNY